MTINFVPVDPGSGLVVGTPYAYPITTDLVGPPAPRGLDVETGDDGLLPNWTPNTDADSIGYDLFLAPPPGQPAQGAGCPGIPGANDAGTTGGGISDVGAAYLVGGINDGMTATGKSIGAYAITGLTDGTTYAVAVGAVDALGNVGPTTPPTCATPIVDGGVIDASIDDTSRGDGGSGDGGSGVTLEKAGCACSHGGAGAPGDASAAAVAGALGIVLTRRRKARAGNRQGAARAGGQSAGP
jgi:MYXO-CTERM domain-containing protein